MNYSFPFSITFFIFKINGIHATVSKMPLTLNFIVLLYFQIFSKRIVSFFYLEQQHFKFFQKYVQNFVELYWKLNPSELTLLTADTTAALSISLTLEEKV